MDVYQRGGDSLLGRYHYWRLHPFSLGEYAGGFSPAEALHRLLTVGGFPEPFLDVDCPEDRQPGALFENLVATHLRKKVDFLEDYTGEKWELAFLRDRDGREVDFVVVRDGAVDELVEAKCSGSEVSRALVHFAEKLNPRQAVQVVKELRTPFCRGSLRVTDPITWFEVLPWETPA